MNPRQPAPTASGRATIADVARHAGVSKATVSRYLNDRHEVLTPDITERVRQAIEALNYRPSPMAQALKHGRSRLIGLAVADITNPFSVAVLQGAEKACQEAGYLLVLFNLGNEPGRERDALQALTDYQIDGLILNRVDTHAQLWQGAAEYGKPIVLVDRDQEGVDADYVSVDNAAVIALALEHLRARGWGEVLLISEPCSGVSSRTARRDTFNAAMAEQAGKPDGLRGDFWESTPDNQEQLIQRLQLLRTQARSRRPAVLAGNAVATLRIASAVQALGWSLGKELGFIGIDETEWAALIGPGLSTIAQPTDALGRTAARCLIERLQGWKGPARRIELPGKLHRRGSS